MEFKNILREKVYPFLKDLEPITLASHHDADGVYSAVLLSKIFEIDVIDFPEIFGEYSTASVSLDLGPPTDQSWDGIAFDHHYHLLDEIKYKLVWNHVPTGLIIYELFKNQIPQEDSWLVTGSLVGDGQPALIPPEIFEDHSVLLEGRASIFQSYGKTSVYEYPLYSLLAAPVNACCRTGKPYQAYRILKTCQKPDDVISHPVFIADQQTINNEITRVLGEFGKDKSVRRSAKVIKHFLIASFESKFRIASRIATTLKSATRSQTVICFNTGMKEISVRGDLSHWLLEKLIPLGWQIGGHPGFVGGRLRDDQNPDDFIEDLRRVLQEAKL